MANGLRRGSGQAIYRSKQVLHALRPKLEAGDVELARSLLSEPLMRLFAAMEKRDQRHAVAVTRRLQAAGVKDEDLLTAALLHDCGKGAVPVWLRIAYVLAPAVVRVVADRGWAPAYRLANHGRLGAAQAASAGAPASAVRLIEGKPLGDEAGKLALLQAADDSS